MKQFIELPKEIEDLFPLVKIECELIKEYFSKEEIDKLELNLIDPTNENSCIYGIMTSSCNTRRVSTFINENLNTLIINENKHNLPFTEEERSYYYMTPLEEYIYEKGDKEDEYGDIIISKLTFKRIQKVLNLLKN